MQSSKFKRFYKLKKIENTYEDDWQIFYPTEWDDKYLAYKYYRQQCIHEILKYEFCHNWSNDSIFSTSNPDEPMPLYNLDNALQTYHSEIEDFQIYHNHLESIQGFDNQSEDIQTYCNENFEDVDQKDFQGIDLDYQLMEHNSDTNQYRSFEGFDENDFKFEEYDFPQEFKRHHPPTLSLSQFLFNESASRVKVVKHKKAKRIRSIKVICVNKQGSYNICSVVHSTVQTEEITSTKISYCHLAKVRIMSQSSNEKAHSNRIEIDTVCKKDVKTHKTFSQVVSWGLSKFSSNKQIQEKNFKSSNTFSETVDFGLPKTILKEQTVSIEAETLKIDHSLVHISTEKIIPSNSFQNVITMWSEIVKGEKHTSLVCSETVKNEMGSNAKTKSSKSVGMKFNKKKKCNFVQLDKLGTLVDIIVEPEQNKEPVFFSYTDVIRSRQSEFVCYRTIHQESKISIPTETESKYQSYKNVVVVAEKHSIVSTTIHPQQKNDTTKIEINDHLEKTIYFAPECKVRPKQKEKWILKKSRRKSSKKTKNNQ